MILIGIGSNLAGPPAATPRETVEAALGALPKVGIRLIAHSRWYLSEPVPASQQPWFINGVAAVATVLSGPALLDRLLDMEARFGRVRGERNAPRTLDLDLLDHEGSVCDTATLTLPHPRLHERRFVLEPLCEIAPNWRHPLLALTAAQLLDRLPPGQPIHLLDD